MNLKTLSEIKGGLLNRMVQAATNRIAQDLQAAPDIADWRTVKIEIRAKPIMEDGELADVIVEFAVGQKAPARITSSRMTVKQNHARQTQLHFQEDAPDNPAQGTLFDGPESGDQSNS